MLPQKQSSCPDHTGQPQKCLKCEVRSRCTQALQAKINTSLCSFHLNPGNFKLPGPGPVGILLTPACPSPFLPHLGYSHPDLSRSAIALFTPRAEICTWDTDRVSSRWEAAPANPNACVVGHLDLEEERNQNVLAINSLCRASQMVTKGRIPCAPGPFCCVSACERLLLSPC